jgi:hypothetical protein
LRCTDEKENTMKRMTGRRALVAGLGAVIAAFTAGAKSTRAQSPAPRFSPARHDTDRWMDQMPGKHRVFVDSASGTGGEDTLRFAGNLFIANRTAYGLAPADLAIIVCYRHNSTPYGYNDAMWAKYGKVLSQRIGREAAATANPLNPLATTERTLGSLIASGAQIAVCATASRAIAGVIARETSSTEEAVLKEIAANLVPNARLVPAGVVAATRAQEYGYSLLSCG